MNVPEQSMLYGYASGEILSARQQAENGRPKGDVKFIGKRSFQLLVTGDTPTAKLLYAVFVLRMEFHQTRNQIARCFVQSRLLFRINKIDLHDEYLASITVKYDSSALCGSICGYRTSISS